MSYPYLMPRTMSELTELLAEHGPRAKMIAGGTDVMVEVRDGHKPGAMIDITRVEGMKGIRFEDGRIHVGPATTFTELYESAVVRSNAFVLAQAALSVGSPQIRNMGTVGGNLANASPAADTVPALMALDAELRLLSPAGERSMPVEDFFLGIGKTKLADGEYIAGISFPALGKGTGSAFLKLGRRNALAISRVSVAAVVSYDPDGMLCTDCRIAVGAVAANPFRVRSAEQLWLSCGLTRTNRDNCVEAALQEISVTLGQRASAVYKKKAGPSLIRRAIDAAIGQVLGGWEQAL